MVKNKADCLAKIGEAFFPRLTLAIGAGELGAIGHIPRIVALDNRSELVVHSSILSFSGE